MKALLDSGVWWRHAMRLPMRKNLAGFLENEVAEWWLSPLSVGEMLFKVKHRRLPAPTHTGWLNEAVSGYRIAPLSFSAGVKAGQWDWEHGDPVDRFLAAVALTEGLTLIHTDERLKVLDGFPQKYFRGTS
jgi:PIN domain nuclease of toxin-antitoxin system